jgi:hypothetical protein
LNAESAEIAEIDMLGALGVLGVRLFHHSSLGSSKVFLSNNLGRRKNVLTS